jgi:tetratricopeptide (TPR) repeat protein/DNA-binding SARP family transcriptional activator
MTGFAKGKQVEFRILGPVQLWANDKPYDLGSRKERHVLAVLLWEQGRPVRASTLIDKVWGDDQPDKAPASLYSYVSRLRTRMREASGDSRDGGLPRSRSSGSYALDVASEEVDFRWFRELRGRANAAAADGDLEQSVALFHEGERQWRGAPLADLSGTWAEGVRARLNEERLAATIERLKIELRLGRHAYLVGELTDLAGQHPLNQEPTRLLMLALEGSGRKPEALQAYLAFRRHLREEVGSDPTQELDELHRRMLSDVPELGSKPSSFQPGPKAAPALLVPASRPATTLPRDNPDFTGRTAELGTLTGWMNSELGRSTVPVMVISGMAGAGKTALAVHAAHLLGSQYPHQVHLELRGHNRDGPPVDPASALGIALRTLGVPGDQLPPSTDERASMWRSRARGALVVLDDALSSEQVLPLLPSSPGCAVLITSRFRSLNLPGLRSLPLSTLPPFDAAALFTKVAGMDLARDPATVASVLALCGHLPIEIQLAATLLRRHQPAWTMDDLIARLREIRAEDRGLTASLELSYRYLNREQQQLLRRIALHPDMSFSGYAGVALAGGSRLSATEREIEALVDYHMIEEPARGRFAFHDLIRQYARHLAHVHDSEQDRRHAMRRLLDYYVRLAERADAVAYPFHRRMTIPASMIASNDMAGPVLLPSLGTRQQGKKWLESERSSLLHAARFASVHGFPQHAGLLPHLLARFLDAWGDWADAIDLHRLGAGAWHTAGNASGEARALTELGFALCQTGRYGEATSHAQEALAIARTAATGQPDEADALSTMGVILWRQARYPEALTCYEQALAIWQLLGDRHGEAETLHRGAIVLWHLRRPQDALRRAEQALAIYRELGDPHGETNSLNNLGNYQQALDHYEQALGYYQQALTMFREIGDRQGQAIALSNIGDVCRHSGQQAEAVRYYRTALEEFQAIGDRRSQAEALIGMSTAFQEVGDHSAAIDTFQKALLIAHSLAERYLQAQAYLGLGEAHIASADYGSAADDFRAAIELAQQIRDPDSEALARQGLRVALRHLSAGGPAEPSPGAPADPS